MSETETKSKDYAIGIRRTPDGVTHIIFRSLYCIVVSDEWTPVGMDVSGTWPVGISFEGPCHINCGRVPKWWNIQGWFAICRQIHNLKTKGRVV